MSVLNVRAPAAKGALHATSEEMGKKKNRPLMCIVNLLSEGIQHVSIETARPLSANSTAQKHGENTRKKQN